MDTREITRAMERIIALEAAAQSGRLGDYLGFGPGHLAQLIGLADQLHDIGDFSAAATIRRAVSVLDAGAATRVEHATVVSMADDPDSTRAMPRPELETLLAGSISVEGSGASPDNPDDVTQQPSRRPVC